MMRTAVRKRTLGVNCTPDGGTEIVLWAPLASSLAVVAHGRHRALECYGEAGFWRGTARDLAPGDRYTILIDGEKELPDPTSLSQPDGVHGASQVLDPGRFPWSDTTWQNHALDDYILYELHTGTYTPEGTFAALEQKLEYLVALGITAIELMPVAQFPGSRNWGYDGVFPFAVQHSYGGAQGLQHLVDTCHAHGLAVVLDVVYNHFGPEGNYFGAYGPCFTEKYATPWGNAVNYDDAYCDGVRQLVIDNALMWLRDFHIDALRLDAVHAIRDFSPTHILRELRLHVEELMRQTGRTHYLIAELDLNDNRFISAPERGGYGMDAQWIDEFHHALRVTSGQEQTGYYSDFSGIAHLAKSYRDAYVFDGQYSRHRKKYFGIPTDNPGGQFVVFSQNHDHVGNRMLGERTSTLVSFEMQKLLAGAVLLSPYLPLLFMGEEYGETNPFLYFVSHTDAELADAVRRGRREEFAEFHAQGEAPDPVAEHTFLRSVLQWERSAKEPHATLLQYYRALIQLRKEHPVLRIPDRRRLHVEADEQRNTLLLARWNHDTTLLCLMNFSDGEQRCSLPQSETPWTVVFNSSAARWSVAGTVREHRSSERGGNPATSVAVVCPESLIVYETSSVLCHV